MSTETLSVAGHSVSPHHYINGQRVASGLLFDLHSPIDQSLLGRISEGTAAHVDAAISAATAAFPAWSALSALQAGKAAWAALMTASTWSAVPSLMRPSRLWSMGQCKSNNTSDATRWPLM